jgi:capsular polysaccharide transport system permease protein
MRQWLRRNFLLVALVLAPTSLAILYFGLIASDVYVSESRFVIRSQEKAAPTGNGLFGQILQGTGITRSQDDTYAVRDYILSRDALKELDEKLNIRLIYSRSSADILARFPGLHWDRSFEELYKYYGVHVVGIDYDSVSAISTLTVKAFSAQDAFRINSLLLEMSERLVNTLNERSREDMIRFAENEVAIASDKAKNASIALLNFRSAQSVFEPDKQAELQLQGVAKLQEELVASEAEIIELQKLSPDNPQISSLTGRTESLRKAIASEASKVTSSRGSFSARAPTFERMALDVEFADKQLGIALAALESARSEARQKQLYIERLVQPNEPDKAMEPRRFRTIASVFIMSLVFWGIATILIASVREHAD